METSAIEFTVSPETETQRNEESEDEIDDDDDDDDDEDVVAEAGQGIDAAETGKPCVKDNGTGDELPQQKVSRFDSRQKRSGFIDVWWLFDDGGVTLNAVMQFDVISFF